MSHIVTPELVRALVEAGATQALIALVEQDAPAKVETPKVVTPAQAPKPKKAKKAKRQAKVAEAAKSMTREEFVAWLRETAEARHARKAGNAKAAEWMRENGLVPKGRAWEAVKTGERDVRALKALNAADGLTFVERTTVTSSHGDKVPFVPAGPERKHAMTPEGRASLSEKAKARPRVNGRFATRDEIEAMRKAEVKAAKKASKAVVAEDKPAKTYTQAQRERFAEAMRLRNSLSHLDETVVAQVLKAAHLPVVVPAEFLV
jgi:hypothetical protein